MARLPSLSAAVSALRGPDGCRNCALPPGTPAINPRTSTEYTATLALLQASIVAVSSDMRSVSSGKPDEHFAARHRAQVLGQVADAKEHVARAKTRCRAHRGQSEGWHPERSDIHSLRIALRIRFDVGRVGTRYSRLEEFRVRGEVLFDSQGSAIFHHGHQAVRPGALFDELSRRVARLELVGHLHRGIVEEQ